MLRIIDLIVILNAREISEVKFCVIKQRYPVSPKTQRQLPPPLTIRDPSPSLPEEFLPGTNFHKIVNPLLLFTFDSMIPPEKTLYFP